MHPSKGRRYYWVLGDTPEGKRVLLGPFEDEYTADSEGGKLLEAVVLPLNTRNRQSAARRVKAALVRRGKSPDVALERAYRGESSPVEIPRDPFAKSEVEVPF